MAEIDEHARRVLYAEFMSGIVDHPIQKGVVDVLGGLDVAQSIEEKSIVLLKNEKADSSAELGQDQEHRNHRRPCRRGHDFRRRLSPGGPTRRQCDYASRTGRYALAGPHLVSHIAAQGAAGKFPNAKVEFASGQDATATAALAKNADVAIVFAYQWLAEGMDLPSLSLPDNQDALIEQVAAANPHTIVVLETGTAVTMPWIGKVRGVVEVWFAGSSGHKALANVLTGEVNPSGKLAMTFPKSDADLPHPVIPPLPPEDAGQGTGAENGPTHVASKYTVHYDDGLKVGYKWYESEHKEPLFPFGFGLSYTTYDYSNLKTDNAQRTVSFAVKNKGKRAGAEIAQVYATLPEAAGEPFKRLVGWQRIELAPGESKTVTIAIDPRVMSVFDEQKNGWSLLPGAYKIFAGPSSAETPLNATLQIR